MSDRLAEIIARLTAATPGPWTALDPDDYAIYVTGPHGGPVCEVRGYGARLPQRDNQALIANAPADLAWCIGEIERLALRVAAQADTIALLRGDNEGPVMLATVVYECLVCGQKNLRNLVRGEPLPDEAGFRAAHRDCDRAPVGKGLRP
jgi:hypothetical protein